MSSIPQPSDKIERSRTAIFHLYILLGYFYTISVVTLELYSLYYWPFISLIMVLLTTSFENSHLKLQLKEKYRFNDRQVKIVSNLNLYLTITNVLILAVASGLIIKEATVYYVNVFIPAVT